MFIITVPFLNLDQIYDSGQVFRWIKFRDGKYAIPDKDAIVLVEQQAKDKLVMSCNDEGFYSQWYEYFDMQTDYMALNYKIRQIDEEMKPKAVRASGVRILRQDLFEIIISFMLATATNIPNIKRMIELIACKCGKKHKSSMRECGTVKWYEFPTPEQILENQHKLGDTFGLKRKENVLQLCQDIVDGWVNLGDLWYMDYEEAKEELMQIEGIGPKVADCICLYGLHMMEAFPIDTHIKQIMKRDFGCDDYEAFADWYLYDVKGYEGLVQQYLFYNEIKPTPDRR